MVDAEVNDSWLGPLSPCLLFNLCCHQLPAVLVLDVAWCSTGLGHFSHCPPAKSQEAMLLAQLISPPQVIGHSALQIKCADPAGSDQG